MQDRTALRLDDVLERMTDAVAATDAAWRITYMNRAAEKMSGRTRDALLGRILWEAYPDLVGTEIERQYRRALDEQVPVDFEFYYAPLELWVETRAYPSPSGLSIYSSDITARKRAELAHAQSESRYRLIAETAHEGIWLADAEYRTVWVNQRMGELVGCAPEAMVGRRVPEFVYEGDLPELRRRMAERREGKPAAYDIRMRRANGEVFWALACIAPVLGEDGNFQGALGMLMDISARKRAEAELATQKEQFRVTLASIGDAVIATDAGGRVSFVNRVAEELTGWPAAEAVGRQLDAVFHIVNELTRERVESPVTKVLREGKVVGLANHTVLIARGGTERPIDDSGAPIRDASGAVTGVVLVFRDNTERATAEQALREADRRKDEFLAMLGHELRNPLAPVASALELMRRQPNDTAATRWAREVIERQVAHMTRLVDDLLDVSRVSRGQIPLRRERAELGELVARACETVRPVLDQRGQRLRHVQPVASFALDVDATRVTQAIANLLHNASKFSPQGAEIAVEWRGEGDGVLFCVRDPGCGFAPALAGRLFEPFSQINTSLARDHGGLGLGLSLVKKLVELHGGRVGARSDGPGKGSEFTIWLPLARGADASAPNAPAGASVRPLRMLVVDDNYDAAQLLASLLRLLGHDPAVAHDAPQTLAQVRARRPEVIVLDIGLPGMDGYELARILRSEPAAAGAKLVALSGYGQAEDRRRALNAGFDLHLVKPAGIDSLQAALGQLFPAA